MQRHLWTKIRTKQARKPCTVIRFCRTVFIYNLKNIFFRFIAGALSRALSLQETIDKHSKIQALAGLICTMIESCPSTQSQQQTLPLYRQLQVSFAPFFWISVSLS